MRNTPAGGELQGRLQLSECSVSGLPAPEQGHFYVLPVQGTPWGQGWSWENTSQPPLCQGSRALPHPRSPCGHPWVMPPPSVGRGSRFWGGFHRPLPYPVFVLADLLHLESLGTLALGHLPGDLPPPTPEVSKQHFGSVPQYKSLLR